MSIVSFNWMVMGCQTKGSSLLPCLGRGGLVRSKEKRETGKRSGLVAKWCFQVFFGGAVNCWKLQENKFAL